MTTTKTATTSNSCSSSSRAKPMAIAYMAMASGLHFAGYEVARSGTLTLLTSQKNGFESGASIVSCAMGTIPLFSIFLLWCYTRLLDGWGPRVSLYISTLCYALLLALSGIFLSFLDALLDVPTEQEASSSSLSSYDHHHLAHLLSKVTLFSLFVVENSYVQLLFTQHWSFITSVVQTFDKEKEEVQKGGQNGQQKQQRGASGSSSTIWFGPIAGAGSLMSSAAGFAVMPLVSSLGLPNLLVVASLGLALGCACSDVAYRIANQNGFTPTRTKSDEKEAKLQEKQKQPIHRRALHLFQRVPIIGALCVEVVIHQCQSSLLSFMFVWSVRESIVNDEERARYNTLAYTWINFLSGILQFTILPLIVSRVDSPASKRPLWLIMPSLMALSSMWSVLHPTSLLPVTVSFCLEKTLEYSIRGILMEMVFVTLDYESVFFGKEIIGLFANRLGKGVMAIFLAGVMSVAANRYAMIDHLHQLLVVITFTWLYVSFRMTGLLKQQQQTQQYVQIKKILTD